MMNSNEGGQRGGRGRGGGGGGGGGEGSSGGGGRRSRGSRGRARGGRGGSGGGGGGANHNNGATSNDYDDANNGRKPAPTNDDDTANDIATNATTSAAATNGRRGRRGKANNNNNNNNATTRNSSTTAAANSCPPYPSHLSLDECLARYEQGKRMLQKKDVMNAAAKNAGDDVDVDDVDNDDDDDCRFPLVIRGKLRVLPGNMDNGGSFVSDDCVGRFARDVWIPDAAARNRALDGDIVYVEILLPPPMVNENTTTTAAAAATSTNTTAAAAATAASDAATTTIQAQDVVQMDEGKDDAAAGDDIICCMNNINISLADDSGGSSSNSKKVMEKKACATTSFWQDDDVQMDLWNPTVSIIRPTSRRRIPEDEEDDEAEDDTANNNKQQREQRHGSVIGIVPPAIVEPAAAAASELSSSTKPSSSAAAAAAAAAAARHAQKVPTRNIVGHLKVLSSGTVLLTPNDRSLPQFKCPAHFADRLREEVKNSHGNNNNKNDEAAGNKNNDKKKSNSNNNDNQQQVSGSNHIIYQAEYEYYSWKETHKWPPCRNVRRMGQAGIVEDEIQALLTENKVDHGEFPQAVVQDVQDAVQSGLFHSNHDPDANSSTGGDMGWKPTEAMYHGRRDYRNQRIFTIDPTTAKDLDDALHITLLEDGIVEVGVHIADVSYFVRPRTAVDQEAQRRATTVYLVDRTIPMLPRPLCEVACSLNENVERLAFSCVWKMNLDGTMLRRKAKNKGNSKNKGGGGEDEEEVWYGRTVIKSCARLDYATAQNIIDGKVAKPGATAKDNDNADEEIWPKSRRPTGGHTMAQVASDVRLMHRVAMARRRMRFDNGALALHGVKITFQLDKSDGQTPLLAAPYPIRDSNRLVEEFMLLANYLVAQRLITHAGGRALLRHHPEPLEDGLDDVAAVAKSAINFDLDITTSATLHASLNRLARECNDPLVLLSVTQMLMTPMKPADYIAAGLMESELWRHFALNIPYYTHFTSPIRRYPDVMVHRLLQATIDGEQAIKDYPLRPADIQQVCEHCNEKRMASKAAQERCDRVFLSIYVTANPLKSELGIVLSVGISTFTVFIPSIGVATLLFLEEHSSMLSFEPRQEADDSRTIVLRQKQGHDENNNDNNNGGVGGLQQQRWNVLEIRIFTKLTVTVYGKEQPPIDVKLLLEGPWKE